MSIARRLATPLLVVLLAVTARIPAAWASDLPGGVTAETLIEFERHVQWDKVAKGWKDRQAGWERNVKTSTMASQLAGQLMQLEKAMGEKAFADSWAEQRLDWKEPFDPDRPIEFDQVAKGLRILEENTRPGTMTADWAALRKAWLQRVSDTADAS